MQNLLVKLKNKKGFTLIELIVVIAILGILAAILIPQFSGFQTKARSTQAMVDGKQIATAADGLYIELGAQPGEAAVADLAGPDIVEANLAITGISNGHVLFTYDVTVGTDSFTVTRAVDAVSGDVTITVA